MVGVLSSSRVSALNGSSLRTRRSCSRTRAVCQRPRTSIASVPRRLGNLVLLAAIATLLVSGIVAWLLPDTAAGILYLPHRVAGGTFGLALGWKHGGARRSLHRRRVRRFGVWIRLVPGG